MPISCSHNLVFCLLSNLSWVTLKIVLKRRFAASSIIVIRIWISKLQFSKTVPVSRNTIRLELKIKHERRLRHCLDCHELIDKSNSFSATSYIKLQKQQVYFSASSLFALSTQSDNYVTILFLTRNSYLTMISVGRQSFVDCWKSLKTIHKMKAKYWLKKQLQFFRVGKLFYLEWLTMKLPGVDCSHFIKLIYQTV